MKITAVHALEGVAPDQKNPRGFSVKPGQTVEVTEAEGRAYVENGAASEGEGNSIPEQPKNTNPVDDSNRRDKLNKVLGELDKGAKDMFTQEGNPKVEIVQGLDSSLSDVTADEIKIAWTELNQ